jgi:hypothetical protein
LFVLSSALSHIISILVRNSPVTDVKSFVAAAQVLESIGWFAASVT